MDSENIGRILGEGLIVGGLRYLTVTPRYSVVFETKVTDETI